MANTAAVDDYKSFVDEYVDEAQIDQNEATSGGGDFAPPEAGRAFARVVEYIELGAHTAMYQGKPKKNPEHEVRITLELSGKKYPPIEQEDGTKVPQRLFLKLNLSTNEKSRFYKLFRALNGMYGDRFKHFSQMVAENIAFIVTISHTERGEGKDKRVYANVWKDGAWQVEAAVRYDDDENPVPIAVSAALSPTKIFLFNRPRLVDWQKLYIEGTRDDGASRNWIQETILSAVNFEGSPLEALLMDLPDASADTPASPKAQAAAATKKAAGKANAKADPLDDI